MKAFYASGLSAIFSVAYLGFIMATPTPVYGGRMWSIPTEGRVIAPADRNVPTFVGGELAFPSPQPSRPEVPVVAEITPTLSPVPTPQPTPAAIVVAEAATPDGDLTTILLAAGWPHALINQALAVTYCESRNHFDSVNNAGPYLGLFQIAEFWFAELGVPLSQVFDPLTNARMARAIYQRGGGWTPWPNCNP